MYSTLKAFEVESSTRARDLVAAISSRLQLKTSNCFAVFVKVGDKGMNKKLFCAPFNKHYTFAAI